MCVAIGTVALHIDALHKLVGKRLVSPTQDIREVDKPYTKDYPRDGAPVVDFVVDGTMADLHVTIDADTSNIEHRTNAGRNAYYTNQLA